MTEIFTANIPSNIPEIDNVKLTNQIVADTEPRDLEQERDNPVLNPDDDDKETELEKEHQLVVLVDPMAVQLAQNLYMQFIGGDQARYPAFLFALDQLLASFGGQPYPPQAAQASLITNDSLLINLIALLRKDKGEKDGKPTKL